MNRLCDDLLLEIFSHLSLEEQIRVQPVCRRWLDLLRNSCGPRRLRIELTQYPRPPRRRLTESAQLSFDHAPTIRPKDEHQLRQLSRFLQVQGNQLQALCLQLTYFNHLQYFLHQPEWLDALCRCCPRLQQLQLHAYGLGLDRPMIDRLEPLLARLTHFAIDYKEEDISKCREQPWIDPLLEVGQQLQVLFIKFKRIAIRFPVHCALPVTMKALHLPSCSLNSSQLNMLIQNGGDRLEQLSLHSITSDCLYLIVKKMPNLRKLSVGIRVPLTDDQSIRYLTKLRGLEQLSLHLAHLIDEPIDNEMADAMDVQANDIASDMPASYTICEILSNCPSVKSLRLKNLPLIRRRANRSWFVKENNPNEAIQFLQGYNAPEVGQRNGNAAHFGVFDELIDQLLEQRLVMDAFVGGDDRQNGNNLFEAEEQRFVMNQLQHLLQDNSVCYTNDSFVSGHHLLSFHARLDEPRLDCHYRHALEALLRSLCRHRRLRTVQITNVRDRFICPLTVTRLVTACSNLQSLEIGSGRCISAEVLHMFADRAQKNPNRRFELKMVQIAGESPSYHHSAFPSNLIII